jgi:transposase
MRSQQDRNGSLFSYVSIEDQIPASHPLRRIRKLYSSEGRLLVPPAQLLLASFLQVFYGIRSERLLNEQIMGRFLVKLLGAPEVKPLLSNEHFSVDGTLLQA